MKKLLFGGAAMTALLLTGCTGAATPTPSVADEDAYLARMTAIDPRYAEVDTAGTLRAGYSLCDIVSEGLDPQLALTVVMDAGFDALEAVDRVHASALLCPKYRDMLLAVEPYPAD